MGSREKVAHAAKAYTLKLCHELLPGGNEKDGIYRAGGFNGHAGVSLEFNIHTCIGFDGETQQEIEDLVESHRPGRDALSR